ncbi:hypothetical protein K3495_g6955 [Podosphaera aphanis]|nr:hypothetical protein K3495_g6955 [Podosphaera aphanis]
MSASAKLIPELAPLISSPENFLLFLEIEPPNETSFENAGRYGYAGIASLTSLFD